MCGIAGALQLTAKAEPPLDAAAVVARINEYQRARGPDGEGLWAAADGRIVLGHRRLAIIDTSAAGAQPMSDVTGRWTVTFNGEIYNYRALRAELERQGAVFRTNSDTEVLIAAVARWGEAALPKLRGMFAFALWDSLSGELWLARDAYGIKPLYVAERDGVLWFASQARALATMAPVDTARDAAGLVGFYLWGSVPEPLTWWAGIRAFPAGHLQRIALGSPVPAPKPCRRIEELYVSREAAPLAPGELRALMLESVRHHLVADVPVGIFLSAGVDSGVIAALAAELGGELRTVTLAFDEYLGTADDEAPLAEELASRLGARHTTVRIGRAAFEAKVDDFLAAMDQPSIDGLNTYLISAAARQQGLKAVLSGLGGDELFGGYPSFRQIPRLLRWRRIIPSQSAFARRLSGVLRALAPAVIPPKFAGLFTHHDVASAYLLRRALHLEDELGALLDESWVMQGLARLATVAQLRSTIAPIDLLGAGLNPQIAALESCWYMRNQLLRDSDWASMANSVELRLPYVDVSLLEHLGGAIASAMPPTKQDLAACAGVDLHKSIERAKTGFTTPVRNWISTRRHRPGRGLRQWASTVHRHFRTAQQADRAAAPRRLAA